MSKKGLSKINLKRVSGGINILGGNNISFSDDVNVTEGATIINNEVRNLNQSQKIHTSLNKTTVSGPISELVQLGKGIYDISVGD